MTALEAQVVTPVPLSISDLDLNERQKSFIAYYLQSRNGTQAAELAGYSGNKNTLGVVAYGLLRRPKIQSAIETYFKSRHLSTDGVLAELSDIASAPWKDFVEVKYGEDGQVLQANLRLTDKIKALELTGKAQGMFVDKSVQELSLSDADAQRIGESLLASMMEAAQRKRLAESAPQKVEG